MLEYESSQEFERIVAKAFRETDWQVGVTRKNNSDFNLILRRDENVIAVKIKNLHRSIPTPHLRKFVDYLDSPRAKLFNFTSGYFISANGFSKPAITFASQLGDNRLHLGTFRQKKLNWIFPQEIGLEHTNLENDLVDVEKQADGKTYIGVFTAKGGVGKTTISAHLAGAFALIGYDVALVDIDPQQNLKMLLPEGIYIKNSENSGNIISVSSYSEWQSEADTVAKIIICDCSPDFERNPPDMVKKFNYCLVPTTLNPLGISKNGHVILSTLEQIRHLNKQSILYVLTNNYYGSSGQKTIILKEHYQKLFANLSKQDEKFRFIDPDSCAIRNSKQLFYWGYHLYTGEEGQLAFTPIGGKCYPKEDFLTLLDYLEQHTEIVRHKDNISV